MNLRQRKLNRLAKRHGYTVEIDRCDDGRYRAILNGQEAPRFRGLFRPLEIPGRWYSRKDAEHGAIAMLEATVRQVENNQQLERTRARLLSEPDTRGKETYGT